MTETANPLNRLLWAIFWVVLPLAVLTGALSYLIHLRPQSGWAGIPLHPQGVATMVFAKPNRGLASIAYQEPYTQLSFSKTWQDALALSRQVDTLFGSRKGLLARSGQWIYRPNGQSSYVEVLETEGDTLAPALWLQGQHGHRYVMRTVRDGTLAEPAEPARMPYVLFWKEHVALAQDAISLEELIEQPLRLEIERQVPADVPYGLLLHLERWGLDESSIGLLPFYPLARLAGEARTVLLLPGTSSQGWDFSGMAAGSLKGLRWPASFHRRLRRSAGRAETEDGWQVRIGQGMAGNRFMVGADDSLAAFRQSVADELIAVRLALPPSAPSGKKAYRIELSTPHAEALAKALKARFSHAFGADNALRGNVPRQLLGLNVPDMDTCFLSNATDMIILSAQSFAGAGSKARQLTAGQDMEMQFSPANQWGFIQTHGPAPLRDLQVSLPITLSRLRNVWISLTGDGVQASVTLQPEAVLGIHELTAKPFFTNLFNSPITRYGLIGGSANWGYAVSQTGRMYFFKPGRLSFAQYEAGPAPFQQLPMYQRNQGCITWTAGGRCFAIDTLGAPVPGYPTKDSVEIKHLKPSAITYSVTNEGSYSRKAPGKKPFVKQLYLPEQEARFEMAHLADGEKIGILRYAPSGTSFYDLLGRKRWEIRGNEELHLYRTGSTELDYIALRQVGDTLQGYNWIGRPAIQLIRKPEGHLAPIIYPTEKVFGLLAVPAGRELLWYRIGKPL